MIMEKIECNHLMTDPITGLPSKASEWGHKFCPKCNSKIENVDFNEALRVVMKVQTELLAQVVSGIWKGTEFTTQKSGVTGIVQEVVANPTGSFRIRLDVDGVERWTTYTKEYGNA